MQGHAMEIGRSYAYREKRGPDTPMLKVKLLDKVGRRGKIKVRFEDGPHPGLEEYIETRQVVCAWGQRQAVIRDEQRAARLAEYTAKMYDKALCEAASAVLESTGESGAYVGGAVTAMDEDELQRIFDRAGLGTPPADVHFVGYRDRHSQVHLPLDSMVMIAKAFAAAEPQTVVEYLDDREEELRIKGRQPGERWYHDHLRQLSPGYALARQWAGLEQEAEMLRKEIARLRSLVSRAAYDLRDGGTDRKSRALLRALDGH
jgi:hypothetical protein